MNYDREIDAVSALYAKRLSAVPKKEWASEGIQSLMKSYAEDVAKIVRDATLRFYESRSSQQPIPADLADMPLFKELGGSNGRDG